MTVKVKILLLSLVVLLVPALTASSATAENTIEAPFWHVDGNRLNGGETRAVTIKNVPGTETVLHATIGGGPAEIRCKKNVFSESLLEGSFTRSDGKLEPGTVELSECTLFTEGKEQVVCSVSAIKSVTLAGKLWLEGTKAAGANKLVVVFQPHTGVLLAEVAVTGASCALKGTYKLEGKFGTNIEPEKENVKITKFILPMKPIEHVWQPQRGSMQEETLGLKLGGNAASIQGEQEVQTEFKEEYNAYAPHETREFIVKGGTLPAAVTGTSGISTIHTEITTIKVVIICKKDKVKGEIEKAAKSKITGKLEECSIEGVATCTVTASEVKISLFSVGTLVSEGQIKEAEEGKPWTEVTISGGSCVLKGTFLLTGTQTCKLPGGELSAITHEIECTPAGSVLKFGTKTATFENTETVKLESGKEWSIV
jgi:hypothetical protein